jgi:uncharacterized protein (TIGR00730 family)
MRNFKSLGVFCGSSAGRREVYAAAAAEMGVFLAKSNIRLVYGAGNVGLMGIMADACLESGGQVCGVITTKLRDVELAHGGIQELIVVETMAGRKSRIMELSDGFVALPGGYGTFDELFEVLTLHQLNIGHKPVGLLNVAGYFDPLKALIEHAVEERFIREEHTALFAMEEKPDRLIAKMAAMQKPETEKWLNNFKQNKY